MCTVLHGALLVSYGCIKFLQILVVRSLQYCGTNPFYLNYFLTYQIIYFFFILELQI